MYYKGKEVATHSDITDEGQTIYIPEVETEAFDEKTFVSHIPVRHWDRESTDNALLKIPNGHFVVIFGRLESHPTLGLYVLAEQIRHFSSNLKTK